MSVKGRSLHKSTKCCKGEMKIMLWEYWERQESGYKELKRTGSLHRATRSEKSEWWGEDEDSTGGASTESTIGSEYECGAWLLTQISFSHGNLEQLNIQATRTSLPHLLYCTEWHHLYKQGFNSLCFYTFFSLILQKT